MLVHLQCARNPVFLGLRLCIMPLAMGRSSRFFSQQSSATVTYCCYMSVLCYFILRVIDPRHSYHRLGEVNDNIVVTNTVRNAKDNL